MTIKALYGLILAGAAHRSQLARYMEPLGYISFKADTDLWLKPEIGSEDEVLYYSYLLCYIDGIFCIHHNADAILE